MCNTLVTVCLLGLFVGEVKLTHGTDSVIQTKIIGGTSVAIGHRPYIASVHRRHGGFVCGAVIVASKWILTALHCIPTPRNKAQFFIRVGTKYYNHGGNFHVFRRVKLYNSSMMYDFGSSIPIHDIALIRVFPKFQFSSRILPARLPRQNEDSPDSLWVSGWGLTSSGKLSKYLQTVSVNKVAVPVCQNMSKIYETLMSERRHICYGGGQRDSCNGDSGGPLGNDRTVYGIVSFGEDCGRLPGVYVKISYYAEWIRSVILRDT